MLSPRRSGAGDGRAAPVTLQSCLAAWAVSLAGRSPLNDLIAPLAYDERGLQSLARANAAGERDFAQGLASGMQ
jgi:hypothetical protein